MSYITVDACRLDWNPLKPMGDDVIVYIVQMSVGETGSYRQVSDISVPSLTTFFLILVVAICRNLSPCKFLPVSTYIYTELSSPNKPEIVRRLF